MLMEKSIVENGFIIDLSNAQNTSQLVYELSAIMEHPDAKGKKICLKLGRLDLKQSQLLSIKALIESMDASLAFIDTVSEQTNASAVSLGLEVSKVSDDMPVLTKPEAAMLEQNLKQEPVQVKTEGEENLSSDGEVAKTVEVHAEMDIPSGPIETAEGIEDIYDEVSTHELSEVIPSENYETNTFDSIAAIEGLLPTEETLIIGQLLL